MGCSCLSLLVFCTFFLCFFLHTTQARWHRHTKHKHTHSHNRPSSPPPESSNMPATSSPEPANPPDDGHNYGVFDVRKFGAVGDGITDDTDAFKMAWETACQVDSAVIHIPYGFKFMIQSTIFTGPCQAGLSFQVVYVLI